MDWSDMPDELLGLILSNIFAQDRYAFSLVCKSWNNAVASSLLYRHSPCLVFTNRITQICEVFQYNTFFRMNFLNPDMNPVIRCSKHGWLLVSQDDEALFFYDPFNNQKIQVPSLPSVYTTVSFFHPPTSPDCFVVGILSLNETFEIGVLRHGDDEWNIDYMRSLRKHNRFNTSLAPPVLCGGKLYILDVKGNIATIDMGEDPIVDSGYVYSKCIQQRRSRKNIKQHFLIKPKDEDVVFAVFVKKDERYVRVFRLYTEHRIHWESVDNLGDRVFYVSNASSFGYTTDNKQSSCRFIYFVCAGLKTK